MSTHPPHRCTKVPAVLALKAVGMQTILLVLGEKRERADGGVLTLLLVNAGGDRQRYAKRSFYTRLQRL